MNMSPLQFTQETGAGAREDSSPRGKPFTSASPPTSDTAACPANDVYTAVVLGFFLETTFLIFISTMYMHVS